MQNGKGDKPRVSDWKKYTENFDQISWSKNISEKKQLKKQKKSS